MHRWVSMTAYGDLGTYNYYKGNYEQAAKYFDSSIQESKRMRLNIEGPSYVKTLNNLSGIYFKLGRFDIALQYANRAEAICRKYKYNKYVKEYQEGLAHALINKGGLYNKLNNDNKALDCLQEARKLCEEYELAYYEQEVYNSLSELMLKKGRPGKAIDYLKHPAKTGTPLNSMITKGMLKGKAYLQLKAYDNAIQQIENSIVQAERYNIHSEKEDAYKELSKIYAITGQHKKALDYQLIYDSLRDSALNRQKALDINELEVKYRTAEKERQLAFRDKELAEKKLNIASTEALSRKKTTWVWISSLSTLLLALIIILLRHRQVNRERHLRQQKEVDLLRATMEGEEAERIRVGKELHDGVSGFLSAIKMNLVTLRMQRSDVAHETPYTNAMSLADEAADELRKTAHNLVPSNLVKKGLSDAIKGFCDRVSHPNGIHLDVHIVGTPIRLNPEKELVIYRIAQELIHNILKHAQASKVLMTISWLDEVLMISIEDNGIGMPEKRDSNGIGMDNIHKRVQSVNGSLEIDNNEDTGTSMYLYFPLAQTKIN